MAIQLGVVMDPIESIDFHKDSTLAMLLEAQQRGWTLAYMEQPDLLLRDGQAWATRRPLTVRADPADWFTLGEPEAAPLQTLDVVLMRKDPPFDMDYVYATYLLELAERSGTLVVNRPRSLRDANEKLFTSWFPQCTPPTLVSADRKVLGEFVSTQGDAVLKPLDAMGGASVFRVRADDPNRNVIIETLTRDGRRLTMAQRFIPEIAQGDKRILLIDGEPIPYALARVPPEGDIRGNLAVGGTGVGVELGERERWICAQVAPTLRDMGLIFVGLDVIGDYLTEINVTSPTCVRQLDAIYDINISAVLMDAIEARLGARG